MTFDHHWQFWSHLNVICLIVIAYYSNLFTFGLNLSHYSELKNLAWQSIQMTLINHIKTITEVMWIWMVVIHLNWDCLVSVQGHTRVIRGCGYIPDDVGSKECYKRTGTHDVNVEYCACKKSFCNSGHLSRPSISALLAALLAAVIYMALIS